MVIKTMKNLLCVKSIMTLMITAMLCVMVYVRPDDYGEVFKNVAIMVATWYFSYQSRKVGNDNVLDSNNVPSNGAVASAIGMRKENEDGKGH